LLKVELKIMIKKLSRKSLQCHGFH